MARNKQRNFIRKWFVKLFLIFRSDTMEREIAMSLVYCSRALLHPGWNQSCGHQKDCCCQLLHFLLQSLMSATTIMIFLSPTLYCVQHFCNLNGISAVRLHPNKTTSARWSFLGLTFVTDVEHLANGLRILLCRAEFVRASRSIYKLLTPRPEL